ncbi:cytochrome P450 [Flagelloscypha sp. PMI_526]|nr:cytochrome P450 [Flagelloscypha sp. PMI_526]
MASKSALWKLSHSLGFVQHLSVALHLALMLDSYTTLFTISSAAFVLAVSCLWAPWKTSPIPTYGVWYIPPFLRGLQAMMALGSNEDEFLLGLYRKYGSIVYIPWPMQQYILTTSRAINAFYASTDLHYPDALFGDRFFPMHSRAMAKSRLRGPLHRFNDVFSEKVRQLEEQVHSSQASYVDIPIVEWVMNAMFDSGLSAIYGPEFVRMARERKPSTIEQAHYSFDAAFPILVAEMVPPALHKFIKPLKDGLRARAELTAALEEFLDMGAPGLDDGFPKESVPWMEKEGLSPKEVAPMLLGDLWASQTNAPPACVALLLRVFQTPGCADKIAKEVSAAQLFSTGFNDTKLNDGLTFLNSCVNETLRTETSSFSIRVAKETCSLDVSIDDTVQRIVPTPKNARVCAVTRVPHLTDPLWGDDPSAWDPARFIPTGDEETSKVLLAKLLKEVRGFGGGVSKCEGRHLALGELKIAVAHFATRFDIEIVIPPGTEEDYSRFKIKGQSKLGFAPKKLLTRPGLGAFHFTSDMIVRVRLCES